MDTVYLILMIGLTVLTICSIIFRNVRLRITTLVLLVGSLIILKISIFIQAYVSIHNVPGNDQLSRLYRDGVFLALDYHLWTAPYLVITSIALVLMGIKGFRSKRA